MGSSTTLTTTDPQGRTRLVMVTWHDVASTRFHGVLDLVLIPQAEFSHS